MSNKEKAPTGAVASAGASMEAAALAGASISISNLNTAADGRQQGFVESILMHEGARGAGAAIRTNQLAKLAGLKDARTLQAEIEKERAAGALILSRSGSLGGYFLPSAGADGKREIAVYVATLRARALNTLRTIKTAKRALRVLDGQQHILGIDGGDGTL